MGYHSTAVRTDFPQAATPLLEVRTSATDYPLISQFCFTNFAPQGATSGTLVLGLGIPGAVGILPKSNPYSFVAENPNDQPSGATVALQWGTAPTVPAKFFRRFLLAQNNLTGSAPAIIKFTGLKLAPSSSLVLWVIAVPGIISNPILDIDVVIEA